VTVSDTLPAGLSLATTVPATINGWSVTASGGTVTATRSDALAAGGSYGLLTFNVNVATNAAASVTNTVTVSGGGEVNTANDTASDPTPIVQEPDLTVSKSHAGTFRQGDTSGDSYTITVNNAGPNTAAGVTVTDVLPANTTFVSATPSQGSCSGTGTVTCSLGLMASGGSATITLVVRVNSGPTVSNTATVTASTTDINAANNSATSNATVNPVNTPTLSTWGLAVFAALLAGCGAILYRRAMGGGTAPGI
jgi:uncharacterized repeat protein (TIGR01451 family)